MEAVQAERVNGWAAKTHLVPRPNLASSVCCCRHESVNLLRHAGLQLKARGSTQCIRPLYRLQVAPEMKKTWLGKLHPLPRPANLVRATAGRCPPDAASCIRPCCRCLAGWRKQVTLYSMISVNACSSPCDLPGDVSKWDSWPAMDRCNYDRSKWELINALADQKAVNQH